MEWIEVAHASYSNGRSETVYRSEFANYFLYRNGKKFQIEEKGTEQTKWINEPEFKKLCLNLF